MPGRILWTDGPSDGRHRTAPEASSDDLAEFSPITHLERRGSAIAPLLIAKAGLDRPGINDSIDAFVRRADELGAPVQVETHPDGRHAFDILDDDDRSREIIEASIGFMRSHLA
jgi:dienelactone hydrolase